MQIREIFIQKEGDFTTCVVVCCIKRCKQAVTYLLHVLYNMCNRQLTIQSAVGKNYAFQERGTGILIK